MIGCRFLVLLGFVLFDMLVGLALLHETGEAWIGVVMMAAGLTLLLGIPFLRWMYPALWLAAIANAAFPLLALATQWGERIPSSPASAVFFFGWALLGVDLALGMRNLAPTEGPYGHTRWMRLNEQAVAMIGPGVHLMLALGLLDVVAGALSARAGNVAISVVLISTGLALLLGIPMAWHWAAYRWVLQLAAFINLAIPAICLCLGQDAAGISTYLAWGGMAFYLLRLLRLYSRSLDPERPKIDLG